MRETGNMDWAAIYKREEKYKCVIDFYFYLRVSALQAIFSYISFSVKFCLTTSWINERELCPRH